MLPETIKEIQLLHLEKGKKKVVFSPKSYQILMSQKKHIGLDGPAGCLISLGNAIS